MNRLRSRKLIGVLSLVAMASLYPVSGLAQTTASDQPKKEEKKEEAEVLEKFTVTGSYLPPAANTIATPVTTITSAAIENSAETTNVLEVLRKTVPQFTGNGNLGNANANVASGSTQGGSAIALRNTSTLVLINGRRAAVSPASASGGGGFVDVNMIPIAAIERIDVLMEGASAIYGSDAVAGVVNVILKTDYEGLEAGTFYGFSSNTGHYVEKSGYVVGGGGNGKTSVTFSAEWSQYTPIMNYQRPYSAVTYGTPTFAGSVNIGGAYYYLNPSITTPTVATGGTAAGTLTSNGTYSGPRSSGDQFTLFNLSQYVTQTIGSERQSFTTSFEHKASDYLKFFGDFLYVNTQTHSQINGQPMNTTQTMKDIYKSTGGLQGSANGAVPAGKFGNPFNTGVTGRNRLVDHPREYNNDDTSVRGVVGANGKIGESGWNWEAAADYNRVVENYANPGVISQPHLDQAVLDGAFNFFSRTPISAADQAAYQVVGTATGKFVSLLKNYDVKVNGKLFDLPGGPVDIAIGAELRQESLNGIADPLSVIDPVTGALGWNGATTFYPFQASRNVKSEFAEIRVPIAKDVPGAHLLEFSGAVRHEDYSDTSNPTVPKFTLRYLPVSDEFAVRASYSKSFSAPQLYNLFGPGGIGFTTPFTLQKYGGGTIANFQTNSQSGSNPGLKPAHATTYSVGVVYSPKAVKGLYFSLDYWNIKQTDLISTIGAANILNSVEALGASSPYINSVGIGSFTGPHPTAPGKISTTQTDDIYVTDTLVNIAGQKLNGFDAVVRYTFNADRIGRFDFESNIGYYLHYKVKGLPDVAEVDTAAASSFSNGTIPRWIAYSSITYTRGSYDVVLGERHIPGVHDIEDDTHTGSVDTFDLSASYTFGSSVKYLSGAKFSLGVRNLFNKFGPIDSTVFTDSNVDTSTYDPVGRFFYGAIKYKF